MTRLSHIVASLVLVALFTPVTASADGRSVWQLGLRPPAELLQRDGESAREAYAELAAERLRKRLRIADVKEFELTVHDATTLRLETGVSLDAGWLEALVAAPGALQLRVVETRGPRWTDLARVMPEGLEIRGTEEARVWSASRSKLESWLQRIATGPVDVLTYPDGEGGFRTVNVGDVVGTERDVRSVKVSSTSRGARFVDVALDSAVAARLAAPERSGVKEFAVVLDGELIAFVSVESLKQDHRLQLGPPRGSVPDGRRHRDAWIHQVAGRLAAPMPGPIAVLKE